MGGDIDRLWIKSEGERSGGETETAEAQFLWGHAVGPMVGFGCRYKTGFQTGICPDVGCRRFPWLALTTLNPKSRGLSVMAERPPSLGGGEYDVLPTIRLILQPSYEVNIYSRDDESRGGAEGYPIPNLVSGYVMKSGVNLRLILAFLGNQLYGTTSDMAKKEGEKKDSQIVFGGRKNLVLMH